MSFQFTPAAQRALDFAALWQADGAQAGLELPELLLGLLAEPECRAALLLAERGVSAEQVRARWPALCERAAGDAGAGSFSSALRASLREAEARLYHFPQPLALATEHLLLGMVASDAEASHWLRERGFDPDQLTAEVSRLAGFDPTPLAWDDEPATDGESSAPTGEQRSAGRGGQFDAAPAPAIFATSPRELAGCAGAGTTFDQSPPLGVWRALDAAANRAGEALRVVEDYARFVLDDAHLTALAKALRHDLAAAVARLPAELRRAARDTPGDVGTRLTVPGERHRGSAADVAAAGSQRAQQALRTLEEFSKLIDAALAAQFEALRYRAYTLDRALGQTQRNLDRLAGLRLCVLVDGRESDAAFGRLVESVLSAGPLMLQLRSKPLAERALLDRARLLVGLVRGSGSLAIINDRPDVAALAQADGVHVGQDDLAVQDARRIVGPQAIVGVSTHSIEQARQAVLDGADYLGAGPTFASRTKAFSSLAGLDYLRAVACEIRLPTFAIGGITAENLPQVLATGTRRVAVSAAVIEASDPAAAAGELRRLLS